MSEAFITDEASRKPLTAVEQFLFWLVLLYVKVKFSLFCVGALCPTGLKTETLTCCSDLMCSSVFGGFRTTFHLVFLGV